VCATTCKSTPIGWQRAPDVAGSWRHKPPTGPNGWQSMPSCSHSMGCLHHALGLVLHTHPRPPLWRTYPQGTLSRSLPLIAHAAPIRTHTTRTQGTAPKHTYITGTSSILANYSISMPKAQSTCNNPRPTQNSHIAIKPIRQSPACMLSPQGHRLCLSAINAGRECPTHQCAAPLPSHMQRSQPPGVLSAAVALDHSTALRCCCCCCWSSHVCS
jgi:hypothetical protein